MVAAKPCSARCGRRNTCLSLSSIWVIASAYTRMTVAACAPCCHSSAPSKSSRCLSGSARHCRPPVLSVVIALGLQPLLFVLAHHRGQRTRIYEAPQKVNDLMTLPVARQCQPGRRRDLCSNAAPSSFGEMLTELIFRVLVDHQSSICKPLKLRKASSLAIR